MSNKIWFITGVSSGLGRAMAQKIGAAGHTVIATVRKPEQISEVNNLAPGHTFGYLLDVNNHAQVTSLVAEITAKYGRIDVLVNNAGYGLTGGIEEASMEEVRQQMETNFFGALAVTQAVLPQMRKQGAGHIFQVSSQAGMAGTAGLGLYNASKFALEGFSEALYLEAKDLGIHVTIVEPGPFRTAWAGDSMKYTARTLPEYAPTVQRIKDRLAQIDGKQPGNPEAAAEVLLKVAESPNPPLRLALGKAALGAIRSKLDWVSKDLQTWEELSLSADYPA